MSCLRVLDVRLITINVVLNVLEIMKAVGYVKKFFKGMTDEQIRAVSIELIKKNLY